jgi:hypothetical protein
MSKAVDKWSEVENVWVGVRERWEAGAKRVRSRNRKVCWGGVQIKGTDVAQKKLHCLGTRIGTLKPHYT